MWFSAAITAIVGAILFSNTIAKVFSSPSPAGPEPQLFSGLDHSLRKKPNVLQSSPGEVRRARTRHSYRPMVCSRDGHRRLQNYPLEVLSNGSSPSPAGRTPEHSCSTTDWTATHQRFTVLIALRADNKHVDSRHALHGSVYRHEGRDTSRPGQLQQMAS
jgi:hypothetical protein